MLDKKVVSIKKQSKQNKRYIVFKRGVDILVSLFGLVLLSPVFLLISLIIKFTEPNGSIFFSQKRIGQYGGSFKIFKFRSMRVNADSYLKEDKELFQRYVQNGYKLEQHEDPRITKIGAFLRKTSLDELPQLLNVLMGNMSLVGPRPIVVEEIEEYEKENKVQEFFEMKPGITGVWQTSGRSNINYPERVYLEISYLDNNSLVTDFKIIFKTFIKVIMKEGAY